jgi:hypothetical protein
LDDVVDELGLLVVIAETELLHAAKAHDDVVQSPQKVEGQKAITGIAQDLGQVGDFHRASLVCSSAAADAAIARLTRANRW